MSIVTLASGGLDSCLMSVLIQETGREQVLLFINYGQINADKEYTALLSHAQNFRLPAPVVIDISNYGRVISSGLTNSNLDIVKDAFLPGRNMMLLLLASSYAVQHGATAVSMGLLREDTTLFPDQTDDFIFSAEHAIAKALGQNIEIAMPLREFYKKDVVSLAKEKGINYSYSCHGGEDKPCGVCISCQEFQL